MLQSTDPFPVTRIEATRRPSVDFDHLPFGTVWSDHMFVIDHEDGSWGQGELRPWGPIEIFPSAKALQYAVALFEGFKAHKTPAGECVLFRPHMNHKRLNRTADRLVMPAVPEELFFRALTQLIDLDRDWLPNAEQGALYIRPSCFCTDPSLEVGPGSSHKLTIMTAPVGPYFAGDVGLVTTREYVRAFRGGTGAYKPAGNYAATLRAQVAAQAQGFDNVIWLDGVEGRYIEECGVMNMFFVIDGTAVTPPLGGTILPGVTRDSSLQILADLGIPCEERRISIEEVVECAASGTLEEAFGCGTAATIAPISRLRLDDVDVELDDRPDSVAGRLKAELHGIQTGVIEDRHGWLMQV